MFSLFPCTNSWANTIPLDDDSWHLVEPEGTGGQLIEMPDAIQFTGSGYRLQTYIRSDYHGNFQDSVINVKWMVHGADSSNDYGSFWLGLMTPSDTFLATQGFMTTDHSWSSSTVINSHTWYYSSFIITPDQHVTAHTTTGNYYDQEGGSAFYSREYDISDTYWPDMSDACLMAGFNDNYGDTSTWMKLGEVSFLQNNSNRNPAPAPEPSTILLMGIGMLGLAKVGRKQMKNS